MKKGYIEDYISGVEVKSGPEELEAVQPYSKILIQDYGYTKEEVRTRPQWRVKSCPSDTSGKYPLDIAIFNGDINEDNLYIVVECKKKSIKDGRLQLEDYLKFSKAELGVWFNGKDAPLYIRKIIKNDGVYFQEIPNIPRKGQRVEDVGKFKRKDLQPAHNLKTIFRVIRNHLAGNAIGTTRDEELARQLINIIFTKIYDEKFTAKNDIVNFRAGISESPEDVQKRIQGIFASVKVKYKDVIDANEKIGLDKNSLLFVVGQLQSLCLVEAERDVVADAFETFIGYALKGPQGQFFTPRNVVKLMVGILDQNPDETVIDPACGSGGFIVESLRHIWDKQKAQAVELGWSQSALLEEQKESALTNIHGIEKDSFLSKVAKAYMAILGDGKGGLFCEDSLESPDKWGKKTQQRIRLNSFDCLLANPPFGKDIKVIGKDKLSQYDLAHKHKKNKENGGFDKTEKLNTEMTPQVLFVERSLQLLRDGGRMGLILPETYFHAPNAKYVMQFMAKHNIYCSVDLPHNTFRPHNNAKCVAIFLEKNKPQQKDILMCVAEEMGHNHKGDPLYRWDHDKNEKGEEIWDDLTSISEEIKNGKPAKYTFSVSSDEVKKTGIYVPRYYWKNGSDIIEKEIKKEGMRLLPMQQLIDEGIVLFSDGHGSPPAENKGKGDIPYIRVKDIVNWEIYKDPTAKIPENIYKKLSKEKELEELDILYVKRGSYRIGSVAMASPYDKKVLLTKEILTLKVKENKYDVDSYYLLYLMSHWITQHQTKNKVLIETTLPNIANRWKEISLPVHNDKVTIKHISNKIKEVIDSKWLAVDKINQIKEEFGNLTT